MIIRIRIGFEKGGKVIYCPGIWELLFLPPLGDFQNGDIISPFHTIIPPFIHFIYTFYILYIYSIYIFPLIKKIIYIYHIYTLY